VVEAGGHTALVVAVDDVPVAVLDVTDRLRPAVRDTVAALAALTGCEPLLLTGDAEGPAHAVAAEAGLQDVCPGLLPAEKSERVRAEQATGARVLLVGDGVNDAPALAAADVGIAMGRQGSDLALEVADAVIVRDDLSTVPETSFAMPEWSGDGDLRVPRPRAGTPGPSASPTNHATSGPMTARQFGRLPGGAQHPSVKQAGARSRGPALRVSLAARRTLFRIAG
jgi:soluble P-type ATPase